MRYSQARAPPASNFFSAAANRGENAFVRMYAVTGLGSLHENADPPRLAPLGFDLDSEQRIDALDEVAGYM